MTSNIDLVTLIQLDAAEVEFASFRYAIDSQKSFVAKILPGNDHEEGDVFLLPSIYTDGMKYRLAIFNQYEEDFFPASGESYSWAVSLLEQSSMLEQLTSRDKAAHQKIVKMEAQRQARLYLEEAGITSEAILGHVKSETVDD